MQIDVALLERKAKKHKKLFEKYKINPFAYKIDNNRFYLIHYGGKKVVGGAIITEKDGASLEDHKEAFEHLFVFSQICGKLDTDGFHRAKNDMKGFIVVKDFLEEIMNEIGKDLSHYNSIRTTYDTIDRILQLQQELIDHYNYYEVKITKIIREIGHFTNADQQEFFDILAYFDYIQFTQQQLQIENVNNVDKVLDFLKRERHTDSNILNVLKMLSSSRETYLKKELQKVSLQDNMGELSEKEHKEVFKNYLMNNLNRLKEEMRSNLLRYPAI